MADHIELSIPARGDLLHLVRLTAGAVAAKLDFGLDDVEDLRLGVEELCLLLVGTTGEAPGRLLLRYGWDDDAVEVRCTLTGATDGAPAGGTPGHRGGQGPESVEDEHLRQELSSHILDALVDGHGETHDEGHPGAWLRMRRVRTPDE
jgi:hypothetical protein